MAFGSLIIAICQTIRICLKAFEMSKAGDNTLVRLALKCAQCAVWCLQKSIEFVSYYGYVYVALEGGNFCIYSLFIFCIKIGVGLPANNGGLLSGVLAHELRG